MTYALLVPQSPYSSAAARIQPTLRGRPIVLISIITSSPARSISSQIDYDNEAARFGRRIHGPNESISHRSSNTRQSRPSYLHETSGWPASLRRSFQLRKWLRQSSPARAGVEAGSADRSANPATAVAAD